MIPDHHHLGVMTIIHYNCVMGAAAADIFYLIEELHSLLCGNIQYFEIHTIND